VWQHSYLYKLGHFQPSILLVSIFPDHPLQQYRIHVRALVDASETAGDFGAAAYAQSRFALSFLSPAPSPTPS
jgi:hypothetical protein